jgi:hypothetical protein
MTPQEATRRIRQLRRSFDSAVLGLVGLERYCDFAADHDLPLPDDWTERIVDLVAEVGGLVSGLSRLALEHVHEKEGSDGRNTDHLQRRGERRP